MTVGTRLRLIIYRSLNWIKSNLKNICVGLVLLPILAGCDNFDRSNGSPKSDNDFISGDMDNDNPTKTGNGSEEYPVKVKITIGKQIVFADFEDNATSRALIKMMPLTLSMQDLYQRELCYRFGANSLETSDLRCDGYQIGDIAYWPPRGSLVIVYSQDGEKFERQHIGHIDSDLNISTTGGYAEVTFEALN